MDETLTTRKVNRRRLLRGAGTVAAGVAGVGVAGAVVASPAEATTGAFDSSSLTSAALTLANTATTTVGVDTEIGPSLMLTPGTGTVISSTAPTGSIAMDANGTLWAVTGKSGSVSQRDFLFTTNNSASTFPVTPRRILDTDSSTAVGKLRATRILNDSGAFTGNKMKSCAGTTWTSPSS